MVVGQTSGAARVRSREMSQSGIDLGTFCTSDEGFKTGQIYISLGIIHYFKRISYCTENLLRIFSQAHDRLIRDDHERGRMSGQCNRDEFSGWPGREKRVTEAVREMALHRGM